MSDEATATADRLLEEALEESGGRDPREFYRKRLKELKRSNPGGYEELVAYYRDHLIPRVASGSADPLTEWTEYGRRLAEVTAPGRTVTVDATGRAHPYDAPAPREGLVLHLPEERRARIILVALPPELTPAQRAAYDVLVGGKRELRA